MRTIFQTRTFKSASFATVAGLIVLIGPEVASIAERSAKTPEAKAFVRDVSSLVLKVAGTFAAAGGAGAILGRAVAKDAVTSPRWMPGPNKPKEGN